MAIFTAKATFTAQDPKRFINIFVIAKLTARVQKGQRIVAEHAKQICPVNTGALQESIGVQEPVDDFNRITGAVVASAPYASFVEFGTGLRGAGTYPGDLPQEGVPITGAWQYDYKRQNWKGQPAQPFMRPALDSARSDVLAEFKG